MGFDVLTVAIQIFKRATMYMERLWQANYSNDRKNARNAKFSWCKALVFI